MRVIFPVVFIFYTFLYVMICVPYWSAHYTYP